MQRRGLEPRCRAAHPVPATREAGAGGSRPAGTTQRDPISKKIEKTKSFEKQEVKRRPLGVGGSANESDILRRWRLQGQLCRQTVL